MSPAPLDERRTPLDPRANERTRLQALKDRCSEYRSRLVSRDPWALAAASALGVRDAVTSTGQPALALHGDCWGEPHVVTWPDLDVTDIHGRPADVRTEALWLHYLDRADGHPLTGRWVNLSQIGGLFYQQAFQGYSGDELAEAWGDRLDELRRWCRLQGGWEVRGMGDLSFEWRVLPRLPVCLCYRLPPDAGSGAWATVLFDAAADHYVAADVAAIVGKQLVERLKPPAAGGGGGSR
jgi:hypothetical protein